MKKFFISIVFVSFFFIPLLLFSKWELQYSLPNWNGKTLEDVFFVNQNIGWIISVNGSIYKTSDAGDTWYPQKSGVSNPLLSIFFADSLHGWCCGYQIILNTTDGGKNWFKSQLDLTGSNMKSIFFSDILHGWCVGSGSCYKTTDGGINWIPVSHSFSGGNINCVFIKDSTVWIAGNGEYIYKTTNSLINWNEQSFENNKYNFYSVFFIDSLNGWCAGGSKYIYKTTDGGINWKPYIAGKDNLFTVFKIFFKDKLNGWIVGQLWSSIYYTKDGGLNWSNYNTVSLMGNDDLESIFFTTNSIGWAVGVHGTIIKTTDGGNSWNLKNYTNFNSINFADSSNGWAVGDTGTILNTTNGGQIWKNQTTDTNDRKRTLSSVFSKSSNLAWIVGTRGYLIKTTDGGSLWKTLTGGGFIPSSKAPDLNSIFFSDLNNGWYVGKTSPELGTHGLISKTIDGGLTWNQNINYSNNFTSVFFTDLNNGYVVGDSGTILQTNDGGGSWNTQTSGTSNNLKSVYFINDFGWIVGSSGTILFTSDGGSNWIKQSSPSTADLYGVCFSDNSYGWAVGDSGVVLITTNGGQNWSLDVSADSVTSNNLRSIYFSDINNGWAAGFNGTIMKYSGSMPIFEKISISPDSVCPGDPITITFTVKNSFQNGNKFRAYLSDSSGSFSNNKLLLPSNNNGSYTIQTTIPDTCIAGNNYKIRIIGSNPAISADYGNLTINPKPTKPTIVGNTSPKAGDIITYITSGGLSKFTWSISPGNNGTGYNTISGGGNADSSWKVQWLDSASYSIKLIVRNSSGCISQDSIPVKVDAPAPNSLKVSLGSDKSICKGVTVKLGDSVTISGGNSINYIYQWSPPTFLDNTSLKSPTASDLAEGNYTYTLNVSDTTTKPPRKGSGLINITVNQIPNPPNIRLNGNQLVTDTLGNSYLWYKDKVLINGETNKAYIPSDTVVQHSYTVKVKSSFGCVSDFSDGYPYPPSPYPQIDTSITSISFDTLKCNNMDTITYNLKNLGKSILNISSAKIVGIDSAYFKILSPSFPVAIPYGSSKTISLQFLSSVTGLKKAYLYILSDSKTNDTLKISLAGIKNSVGFTLSKYIVSFIDTAQNHSLDSTIILTNNGTLPLVWNSPIRTKDSNFTLTINPKTTPTNGTSNVIITYNGGSFGTNISDTITLIDDCGKTKSIFMNAIVKPGAPTGFIQFKLTSPGKKDSIKIDSTLKIMITTTSDLTLLNKLDSISADLVISNGCVLYPQSPPKNGYDNTLSNSNQIGIIHLTGFSVSSPKTYTFLATIGNDSTTKIYLSNFQPNSQVNFIKSTDTITVIEKICDNGGPRFIDAFPKPKTFLTITPNPVSNSFDVTVTIPGEDYYELNIHNYIGQKLTTYAKGKAGKDPMIFQLDASDLQTGIYMLVLKTSYENVTKSLEVIK